MRLRLPTPLLVALIAAVTAGLTALGVWQLQRNEWKRGIVEERQARTAAAPVAAASLLDATQNAVDWRRVEASGTWDHERTMVVSNRARFDTLGEEVVTPLLLGPSGPALLVSRGWYPREERERVLAELRAEREGRVEGLARARAGGGRRTAAGSWTRLDPVAMGAQLPYPTLGWALLEGRLVREFTADGGQLPHRQYLGYRNTTPHLEYAVTWFALAAALVVIALVRFVIAPRRGARQGAPPPTAGPCRR